MIVFLYEVVLRVNGGGGYFLIIFGCLRNFFKFEKKINIIYSFSV